MGIIACINKSSSIIKMNGIIKQLDMKEKFIGVMLTLMVGLLGWTSLNLHIMTVNMMKYEVANDKDHIAIVLSIDELKEKVDNNIEFNLLQDYKIQDNKEKLIRLEAILPKDEEDD